MKVVILSTYPFSTPRHGGQHRLHHIAEAYRAAGHVVRAAGVLGSTIYAAEPHYLAMPSGDDLVPRLANPFLMEDWIIGRLCAEDDGWFERLADAVGEPPQIVHVEQPWLFAFARRYRNSRTDGCTHLLYGSQNIEHALKRKIIEGYMGDEHARACEQLVLATELEAIRDADSICAVSPGDLEWLQANGARDVVMAANGVPERRVTVRGIAQANRIVGHRRYALYCASGHPPNVVGFYDMFGAGVGCLAPEDRLVVVGSAGNAIQGVSRFAAVPGLSRQFIDAGEVDEETLQGLIHCAHTIVLPITQGGGTNLKTAEALWSGHHVVGTHTAMRGFEVFNNALGVTVCDDAVSFRNALRESLTAPPLRLPADEQQARRAVTWSVTLHRLVTHLRTLEPAINA